MRERPPDLDERDLAPVLEQWGISAVVLDHLPVGFGDHHWSATDSAGRRWFVKVADLTDKRHCGPDPAAAATGLRRAMDTAADLTGLDFVVAPLRDREGRTTRPLGTRWAVSVFPWLEGTDRATFHWHRTATERAEVIGILARLHRTDPPAATPDQPMDLTRRATLDRALAPDPVPPAVAGPYTVLAWTLVADHRPVLRRRLVEFGEIASTAADRDRWVITHGEPHPGNLFRGPSGYRLIDWDTVGLAVPERDLSGVTTEPAELARYPELTGREVDPRLIRGYRLRWDLEEIGIYLDQFARPHRATEDTELAWTGLKESVARLAGGGEG